MCSIKSKPVYVVDKKNNPVNFISPKERLLNPLSLKAQHLFFFFFF